MHARAHSLMRMRLRAEDESGDHFRDFLSNPEQDLDGFDDMCDWAREFEASKSSSSKPAEQGGEEGETPDGAAEGGEAEEEAAEAVGEELGVDIDRTLSRPPLVRARASDALVEEQTEEAADGADASGADASAETGAQAVCKLCFSMPAHTCI